MLKYLQSTVFLLTLCFASFAFAQAGDRMLIDFIDMEKYEDKGIVRYYVDILDKDNRPIEDQDQDGLTFFLNDEPVDSELIQSIDMESFQDTGEPIAVGFMFTNYAGFVSASEGEGSLYKASKSGIVEFMKQLTPNSDRVGAWIYDEESMDYMVNFTGNISAAIETIEDLEDTRIVELGEDQDTAEDGGKVPDFYRYLSNVVNKMADNEDLPRRRILVVISDGRTATDRSATIERKLTQIIERARDAGIKIYSFAASSADQDMFPYLSRVADETYGVYRKLGDSTDDLEAAITDLDGYFNKQYVIDLTAPGLPADDKVKFRLDATLESGPEVTSTYPRQLAIPETPTNWSYYLWWTLGIIGGLIGLFLFIWLIKKIVQWRSNRPAPESGGEGPMIYEGADRGKLWVKSGPLAGEFFHLIEDITTIGSIDGNHIVLYDEGVSKRHAGIKIEEMRYELADFGSTNGTYVNGRKINKQFLRDKDEIRIGNTEMTFTLK